MNIKILGGGCTNCHLLEQNVRSALVLSGKVATVDKVTDKADILSYGVERTPALVVDGEVKSFGRVLAPRSIVKLLEDG